MSKLTEALNILANTDCASFKRSEPTAEEALEWLFQQGPMYARARAGVYELTFDMFEIAKGETPLEAIRNAMKGEGDGG